MRASNADTRCALRYDLDESGSREGPSDLGKNRRITVGLGER